MMLEYTVKVGDSGNTYWYLNDKLHCEHRPAIEYANGSKFWYLNGVLHRPDGPAIEFPWCGVKEWWLYGEKMTEIEFNKRTACKGKEEKEMVTKEDVEEALAAYEAATDVAKAANTAYTTADTNAEDAWEACRLARNKYWELKREFEKW